MWNRQQMETTDDDNDIDMEQKTTDNRATNERKTETER